ncbi:hypothetical protein PybrP1_011847 [[Pythium] brassicae (nom. inval.)]|nr:hypothetical protein PybrP1_011847 [[Pythium] brassicae (nom. inval.)]
MPMMSPLPLDAPLGLHIVAPTTRTVFVRMRSVSGSVAVELSPALTSVHELIRHVHERVFSKSYMAFVRAGALLAMRADPKTGAARETPIRDLRELHDAEMLVYAPCEELRTLVEQGCITPSLAAAGAGDGRSPVSSPSSSPSLKRKGRVSSVTSNVERVHRYGSELAKMDVSPREKAQIEDLLTAGDEQAVDAMEQFVLSRNTASVRRVLRGPASSSSSSSSSSSPLRPLETLALDFSSLDVHSPAAPATGHVNPLLLGGENPFLLAATTSFHPVTEQSRAFQPLPASVAAAAAPALLPRARGRPSLLFSDDELGGGAPLPSIREKVTPPPGSRLALSLDDLVAAPGFDERAPQLFSIAQELPGVPVARDFDARFALGAVLGAGKYSVVRACTERATGAAFAVKVIDKRQMMEVKFLKRELEIMYGLRHEGVAQLVALFENNDAIFLVLERCRQELFEYIDRAGPLSEATARKLSLSEAASLQQLPTDDELLAAAGDGGVRNRLARAHTKCGTRDYVAPEVMSGKGYGTEADLWSVGVVTFVLVSGCAPVFLPTADGTRKVFFPDDDGVWANVSNDMKRFIESLLVRNAEERATAAEALEHPWLRL